MGQKAQSVTTEVIYEKSIF